MFKDRYQEGYEAAKAELRLEELERRIAALERDLDLIKRLLGSNLPLLEGPDVGRMVPGT